MWDGGCGAKQLLAFFFPGECVAAVAAIGRSLFGSALISGCWDGGRRTVHAFSYLARVDTFENQKEDFADPAKAFVVAARRGANESGELRTGSSPYSPRNPY